MSTGGAVEAAIQSTQDALVACHSVTGLPWFLAIPAFALGVNLIVRMPLQVYSRHILVERLKLAPFVEAWKVRHARMVGRKLFPIRFGKTLGRIHAERGLQSWKMWTTALSIPPWLMIPEALRRMMGVPGGFFSLFLGRYQEEKATASSSSAISPGSAGEQDSVSVLGDSAVPSAAVFEPSSLSAGAQDTLEATQSANPIIESLADGGILWFSDLTVADPYGLLPFTLAGLLMYTWIPSTSLERRAVFNLSTQTLPSQGQQLINFKNLQSRLRLRRAAILASVIFPLAAMKLPAGIFLYWVSSVLFSKSSNYVIERLLPAPKGLPTRCMSREPMFLSPPR